MVTIPVETPVTRPVVALTVAIPVLLLLHVPPVLGSLSGNVKPTVTPEPPEIGPGRGFTVKTIVVLPLPAAPA